MVQAQQSSVVRGRMEGFSLEIRLTTPQQFAEIIRADYDRWGQAIRASGFKAAE